MNKLIFITILTITPSVFSQISIDAKITASMKYTGLIHRFKHGNILCGRISGKTLPPEHIGPSYPNATLNYSQNKSGSLTTEVIADNNKTIRTIGISSEITSSSVNINLTDRRPYDKNIGKDSYYNNTKCTHTEITWNYSEPNLTGHIKVNYKVPDNTYLVILKRKIASHALDISWAKENEKSYAGLENTLNRNLDDGLVGKSQFLWVHPGKTITQTYNYFSTSLRDNKGQTINFEGQLEYEFIPIRGVKYTNPTLEMIKLVKMSDQIINMINKNGNIEDEKIDDLAKSIAMFIGEPSNINNLVQNTEINTLKELTDEIRGLRDSTTNNMLYANLKLASTILNAKIAEKFISDILPFCESTAIELPYQQTKLETNWITAANYLLSRTKSRLSYYNTSHIRALLELIVKFEKDNYTYSEIRLNEHRYRQMVKAYQILRSSTDLRATPITASLDEMNYLVKQVGTLGVNSESQIKIINSLEKLSDLESIIARELMTLLREFQPNNDNRIEANKLLAKLERVEIEIGNVIQSLDSGQQLFSTTKYGLNYLTSTVTEFAANDIEVFLIPKKSKLEYFRTFYFSDNKFNHLTNKAMQCWKGK